MSEKPDKAEGTHSNPSSRSGFGEGPTPEDFSVFDLERPAGYPGHSQPGMPPSPGAEPDPGAGEVPTHHGDPYDYGAADQGGRGQGPQQRRPAASSAFDEAPPVLDREMLARELAADRARAGQQPQQPPQSRQPRQPRQPRQAAYEAPPTSQLPKTRATAPWEQSTGQTWTQATTGQHPAAPKLSRILGDESASGARFDPRRDDQLAAPFTPMQGPPTAEAPKLELALDAAYRWRTALGLGMAALMTLAVVIAYRPKSDGAEVASDRQSIGADGQSAIDGVTDFGDESALDADLENNSGSREVESQVDGRPTTTAPPTTRATTTTTAAEAAAPAPTPGPTAAPDPDPTAAPDPDPTPAPTSTSTSTPSPTSTSTPTTAPSTAPTVAAQPVLQEFEKGSLLGTARVREDHEGFSGDGFVGDLLTLGSGVSLTVDSTAARTASYTIRYATPTGGPAGDRTLTLKVNDAATTVTFPQTASVTTWATVTGTIDLAAGTNTIELAWAEGDSGWVNLDSLQIDPPAPATP